jgi:CRP-like cAMP-binding protein
VGEMAAIDGQPRSANVIATEDSLVAVLDAASFIELLKQFGTISFGLLQRLSMMVRTSGDRVVELSVLEAKQRVCSELLRLSKLVPSVDDLWGIEPLPSLRQIAGSAGTTREITANTLSQLYARNIANRKGENLYIADRKALEEFAKASL